MNRTVAAVALVVTAIALLIAAPWNASRLDSGERALATMAGRDYEPSDVVVHRPIFSPPEWREGAYQYTGTVSTARLILYLLGGVVVSLGAGVAAHHARASA